ncbi:hypothetical protein M8C21_027820 [Ambrosia artemisiifolia]|uniref:Hydroxymethylglutaryl-CoA reductase (NADPH) n=1 Tax=Ambrosia artemisiifolia TaxID=4212 RepID=A0AAD5GHH6_AMBAR|nr:hypothetical protein M8C21_027820 [Ambrosia artemisiifolia]
MGYVKIPVGVTSPLLLDGMECTIPMATTECLVANTNRGCKSIYAYGGTTSVLKDGMMRAPIVRFATAKRAFELKLFLGSPNNFQTLDSKFNK